MGEGIKHKPFRIQYKLILIGFLLSCFFIIITTPIHEGAHWVMSELDPYIEPVEFHVFDKESFQSGNGILSSALGCVVIEENYPGAFDDRPPWADALQELICISIQIILAVILTLKIELFLVKNRLNSIPVGCED